MDFNLPQPQFDIIPEMKSAQEALHDTALRVQQSLIALEVYENQLNEVHTKFPGLHIDGYELKDIPLYWSGVKDPSDLAEKSKRSVTFTLLSALNFHLYLLDAFMFTIAKKYYNLTSDDDESWVTPEVFQLVTGIELNKLPNNESIEELRRICKNLRSFKKTMSLSIADYFELYQKICSYVSILSWKVSETLSERKRLSNPDEMKGND